MKPSVADSATHPSPIGVRACLRAFDTPIQSLKGVGPKRASQLESFGLTTIEDLLYHLPFRYEDRRQIRKIASATPGEEASFVGRLLALQKKYNPRRRSQLLLGALQDDSGSVDLIWYRAPRYLAKSNKECRGGCASFIRISRSSKQ